ncbi:hypothetical protein Xen7305DRAFT_00011830 [Xenococcus sp. PCC 7305]|uniref:hypothetical protein n=1 Tax=Xenococcus sp. PCC 7305 TaxID=102125 RepID=UPI0002ABF313|nr:hypothetical protein [Xenococcus sp. PCC 7305]ELS01479.1 hypothetical protein Xen7305DRAFT_00011830 [Xenococcus sp. PCC 7305]
MMWQKIILQSKKNSSDKGFLTIEIIVATLVAFFFLMFSLQALAAAMLMKFQAQQDQRADNLIQEDIERLGGLSRSLTLGLDAQLAADLPTACNVDIFANGYAFALLNSIPAEFANGAPALDTPLLDDVVGGVELRLSRTALGGNSVAPHQTLGIYYRVISSNNNVFDDGDDVEVANRYVEIIPDEALRCP